MKKGTLVNFPERISYAKQGCTIAEFCNKFGIARRTAEVWFKQNNLEPKKVLRAEEYDISPRNMEDAWNALFLAIVNRRFLNSAQARRRIEETYRDAV